VIVTAARRNNFDLLRLLAATQVVYFHGVATLGLSFGAAGERANHLLGFFPGVPIFFAISGFLIMQAYERAADVRSYARNRILRVFPGLWVCFAMSLGLLGAFGMLTSDFVSTPSFSLWIAGQLTVVQFYNPEALRRFGVGVVNGSLWTIPVELQFYAVVPLMHWLSARSSIGRRTATSILALATLGSFSLWLLTQTGPVESMWQKLLQVTLAPNLFMFLFGVMLLRHWTSVKQLVEGRGWLWLAVYLGARLVQTVVQAAAPGAVMMVASWTMAFVSFALLALATISLAFTNRAASAKLLRGHDLSYGMYIFHMLVLNTFVQLGLRGKFALLAPAVLCTALLAAGSWLMVERPALALKRSYIRINTGRTPRQRAGATVSLKGPIAGTD
jgi:peptidoglycan/LPS O-acetylase OafA/YrhL